MKTIKPDDIFIRGIYNGEYGGQENKNENLDALRREWADIINQKEKIKTADVEIEHKRMKAHIEKLKKRN